MNTRICSILSIAIASTAATLLTQINNVAAQSQPPEAAAPVTEDVVFMSDGRELRGQIVSETRNLIIFEYFDAKLNLKSKMTLLMDNIAHIDRDVAIGSAPAPVEAPATPTAPSTPTAPAPAPVNKPAAGATSTYGITRFQGSSTNVPSFYVVPMKGQMGTDIRSSVYEDVIQDIQEQKPDLVILEIECSDNSELMYPDGYDVRSSEGSPDERRRREWGMLEFDDYRELISLFRDKLRGTRQIVWVRDSDGVSALLSLAWPEIYMSPAARLGTQIPVVQMAGAKNWSDPDIRAKMVAAISGIAQGFLERGGYSTQLAAAMIDDDPKLSGNWRGRQMVWQLDDSGEYLVDGSDERAAYFTADTAEDFCISQGTATDLDDLALLLGYREYRLIEGRQADLTTEYVKTWRRLFGQTKIWAEDFQEHMGWASGGEELKWLGRAKQDLENIIKAMERYKAVELRCERDMGMSKLDLITQVEEMKEQIQALKRGAGGAGGGGRGAPGGGGAAGN